MSDLSAVRKIFIERPVNIPFVFRKAVFDTLRRYEQDTSIKMILDE